MNRNAKRKRRIEYRKCVRWCNAIKRDIVRQVLTAASAAKIPPEGVPVSFRLLTPIHMVNITGTVPA